LMSSTPSTEVSGHSGRLLNPEGMSVCQPRAPAGTRCQPTYDLPLQSLSGRGAQTASPKTSALLPRAGPTPGCIQPFPGGRPPRCLSWS